MPEETEKKGFIKSLLSDKEWDWDLSKFVGFGMIVAGCVGFFMQKTEFQYIILTGAGLLGWKSKIEGV